MPSDRIPEDKIPEARQGALGHRLVKFRIPRLENIEKKREINVQELRSNPGVWERREDRAGLKK